MNDSSNDEGPVNANSGYVRTGFWLLALLVSAVTVYLFLPFLSAIVWAIVFSVLMHPLYARLRKRRSEAFSAAMSVLATIGVIVLPLCLFGLIIYVQFASTLRELHLAAPAGQNGVSPNELFQRADEVLQPALQRLGVDFKLQPWFEENRQQIVRTMSGPLTKFAVTAGHTLLNLVIALLTMFFMLKDGHRLREPALDLTPLPREKTQGLLEKLAATIRAVFVGVVLVSVLQGALAGIAYAVLGVPNPILWGIVTIFICMIPLLGAPAGYVPVSIYLIVNGQWIQGLVLLGIGFGIISNIDNFIRPIVIGNKTELHYMAVFFGLLGGVFAFGAVGIMAGPLILTLMLSLIQIAREMRSMPTAGAAEPS